MQLSSESVRVRWTVLLVIWVIAATLLFWHASIVRDYLSIAGALGLRGAQSPGTPLQQAYPAFAADAQTWVRHALSLLEGNDLQLRYTMIDNAPTGREVHWNSAWAWLIASSGWLNHWLTGLPVTFAIERAVIWIPPVVLTFWIVVLSSLAARRAGLLMGVILGIAMVGHPRIFEGFFPSYVDHHGLLTVAVIGLILGATLMGAGWWQEAKPDSVRLLPASPGQAREAAVISALMGAFGLWVSAASVIAPIAIVGCAGFAAILFTGREEIERGSRFDPQVWRTWGRVGAAASLFFYLVEYFPRHLGFRLESNHPFYALAWWGAGESIAEFGRVWLGWKEGVRIDWRKFALAIAAIALAPATIAFAGTRVFLVIDPFLAELHQRYIQEFLPLWRTIHGTGWRTFANVAGLENIPLLVGIGCVIRFRTRGPVIVWFATIATALFTAMAWIQSRWLLNASGSQVCLTIVLLAFFLREKRPVLRWVVAVVVALLLFFPSAVGRITAGAGDVNARRVAPKDAQTALARDIAAAIRRSQPTGEITLLTSPNSSTSVGYYGRFKTLGTLYWENAAGLKAAATVLGAQTSEEAAALVRKHGITHIAMISDENFIEEYYRLLHPNATDQQVKNCFGHQLLYERVVPPWLQMLPYKVPDDLAALNITVFLFRVAFDQTPADALYHIALAKVAMGTVSEAERDFDTLIKQSPDSYQPYLRKAELLYARQEFDKALNLMVTGIQRAPEPLRAALYGSAAGVFFRDRHYGQTIALYRTGLKEKFDPQLAAYLAFVLSTAKDDRLRNGKEAITLAQKALDADPNSPTLLNSLAAALAETGRYDEAVNIAKRAMANAKISGDAQAQQVTEQRLAAFGAGKPWRE